MATQLDLSFIGNAQKAMIESSGALDALTNEVLRLEALCTEYEKLLTAEQVQAASEAGAKSCAIRVALMERGRPV